MILNIILDTLNIYVFYRIRRNKINNLFDNLNSPTVMLDHNKTLYGFHRNGINQVINIIKNQS